MSNGQVTIIQEMPITASHLIAFHKFPYYQCHDPPPIQTEDLAELEWDDSLQSEIDSKVRHTT